MESSEHVLQHISEGCNFITADLIDHVFCWLDASEFIWMKDLFCCLFNSNFPPVLGLWEDLSLFFIKVAYWLD